jgi:hypothetical protein
MLVGERGNKQGKSNLPDGDCLGGLQNALRWRWRPAAARSNDGPTTRIVGDGNEEFCGDLTVRDCADAGAWGELTGGGRRAADVQAEGDRIVDAVLSGAASFDSGDAIQLVSGERRRAGRLHTSLHRIPADLRGDC